MDTEVPTSELDSSKSVSTASTTAFNQVTPSTTSDFGYSENRSVIPGSYHSSHSTPLSYDSGYSFQTSSHYQFRSNGYNMQSSWPDSNTGMAWDHERGQWVEMLQESRDKSPVRESLDSRIELLLKQHNAGGLAGILEQIGGMSGLGSPPFVSSDFKHNASQKHKKSDTFQKNYKNHYHETESDAILGTPPSPFLSASVFIKWHKVTKDFDSGKNTCLDSDEEDEEGEKESKDEEDDDATPVKDEPRQSKKSRSKNVKRAEDDDDDRMSLSSLSSGEKLQMGGDTSEPSTSNTNHPMYPSEQVQMMARLGIWKPGMGSGIYMSTTSQANFANQPENVFSYSYPAMQTGQQFTPSGTTLHPYSQFNTLYSQPGFYPGYDSSYPNVPRTSHLPHLTNLSSEYVSSEWQKQSAEARRVPLTQSVLESVVSELKEIIKKDICKKMVESTAFKNFENWWDESEKRSKTKGKELDRASQQVQQKSSEEITQQWSSLSLYDTNKGETYNNFGFGFGLRAAIPKMPSFRRKYQPSSPTFEDDGTVDAKKTESDIEGDSILSDESDTEKEKRRRNRAAAVVDEGRSDISSDELSSDKSSSESDSESGSSSSESESDESESESEASESDASESDSSFSSSKGKRLKKKRTTRSSSSSSEASSEESSSGSDEEIALDKKKIAQSKKKEKSLHKQNSVLSTPDESLIDNAKSTLEYEASEALMALASGFNMTNETEKDVLNDNEIRRKYDRKKKMVERTTSDTDSASEVEGLNCDVPQASIAFDHSYCLPSNEHPSKVNSLLESSSIKAKSDKINSHTSVNDHMYSRSQTTTQAKSQQKPKRQYKRRVSANVTKSPTDDLPLGMYAVASEWRKAKRGSSNVTDIGIDDVVPPRAEPVTRLKVQYKKRDILDEMNILYEFLKTGIDTEDVQYMKRSYEAMLQEDNQIPWLNDIHWVDHCPTNVPSPKKKRKTDDSIIRVHKTGCARSEGYYKMDAYEKNRLSYVRNLDEEAEEIPKGLRARQTAIQQSTREARSNQRRLLATVDASWIAQSDLLKFNQLQVQFC